MKLHLGLIAAGVLVAGSAFSAQESKPAAAPAAAQQQKPPPPLTAADRPNLSYAIGFQVGDSLVNNKTDVDINQVVRALQDAYAKRQPTVNVDTMRDVLGRYQYEQYSKAQAEFTKLSAENKAKAQRFFAENRSKPNVKTLPSGVQYVVIEDGTGNKHPTLQSEVTANFRLSLLNGQELDSSFARGQPFKFKVSEVLKGWQEVLPLMKIGDYWRVYVPSELAYGERGDGRRIGPDEALVFELKLMDVSP
ncbi:MAG: FKBP-type peptidyl-prolyl cis-trans isomerase [Rudaea sp.]|uniref:FKBP-type peptidyl-prolyl cis-trans isomerase n=1 Tax=Rudaea sp. TaxID=2136325 RepID=UPI0039E409E2